MHVRHRYTRDCLSFYINLCKYAAKAPCPVNICTALDFRFYRKLFDGALSLYSSWSKCFGAFCDILPQISDKYQNHVELIFKIKHC